MSPLLSMIVIWSAVVLYLLWLHVTAAFSNPPVPARATIMPSFMAVVVGAGLSGLVILTHSSKVVPL